MSNKHILTEADSRMFKLNRKIEQVFKPYFANIHTDIVRGSDYYVHDNPNTVWFDYLKYHFLHEFELSNNRDYDFLNEVARIAYDELDFDISDAKTVEIGLLADIVWLCKQHRDEKWFEKYFVGKSWKEIYRTFKPFLDQLDQEDIDNCKSQAFSGSDYQIIKNLSFEEASKIGNFSGENGLGKICYTQSESTWDGYTQNGKNICYCLLKKGWQNIPCEHTEQVLDHGDATAYDRYGVSMIFLFVNANGEITNSNSRWNHRATYGDRRLDKAFTRYDIQNLIGQDFFSVFDNSKATQEKLNENKIQKQFCDKYNDLLKRMN